MASPDFSDGCMIALYPPPDMAETLAVDGGLTPAELHVTVAYCGNAADIDGQALRKVVTDLAARKPITAQFSGHARFTGGDKDVIVALVDSADLEDLRRDTLQALRERGIDPPRDHGYVAHCTITYLDPDEPSPLERLEARPVEFTALSAVHGTDRTDSPLEHPIAAPAREAFAAGWAASGGPMTPRVHAASVAAVAMAVEHADDPRILEVTVDLGRLEGMWATLFGRREQHIRDYTAQVTAAWRDLLTPRVFRDGIHHYRADAGLTETDDDERQALKAAALAAATGMLRAIIGAPGWAKLRQAIRDAIAAGRAEGMVNAVAVAAERAAERSTLTLDWDIAFQHAYQQLERLDELWADVDTWLDRIVGRAAADLGRTLAEQAAAGGSYEDMLAAATDLLDTGDVEAVSFVVDWAMTTAADQGALSLYQAQGVQYVNWISAGDGRVCPTCQDNEDHDPWPIGSVPQAPAHPRCRCVLAADMSLGRFASWFTKP